MRAWDLLNGRLVRLTGVSLGMANTYWIVCPKVTAGTPKIAAFRDWMLAEAVDDAHRLQSETHYTVD